ncbi:asparaginase domain-containing protein [Thiofaba sp. EF100]|uniref:asparaginase domain-containing protein n=1 Tax=Thiofaba sp. EF100 TaxID=3121274 RepID=UPI003221FBF0
MADILILNTGGTFNKRYDEISGELFVPQDEQAVEAILAELRGNLAFRLVGLIHKDSLAMDDADREQIAQTILAAQESKILIVHGTDTMHLTAAHLAARCPGRRIVLTGAMKPYAYDRQEAVVNLALSLGWLIAGEGAGVHIGMHGLVRPHAGMVKDRVRGVFRAV